MNSDQPTLPLAPLSLRAAVGWSICAVGSFHLAYEVRACAPLFAVFLLGLLQLARLGHVRAVVYTGLAVGLCVYGSQLWFFWSIFHAAAIALWLIPGFWLACFLLLQRLAWQRLGSFRGTLCAPLLWTGVEYVRSELYPLRFSWLNAGYLMPRLSRWTGMYGAGFVVMAVGALLLLGMHRKLWRPTAVAAALALTVFPIFYLDCGLPTRKLSVAGVQLEQLPAATTLRVLDKLYARYPDTPLFVLSEYTFAGPVPAEIKAWCARRQRWLIVGGEDVLDQRSGSYRNTAFVIGPDGSEVFRQSKSVPIQFFSDGLPAERQALWQSPWGKIGICICYDLSYTRVTDALVRQGAQAIIVPTMDVMEWGPREHALHARVAPTRAAEYGVPIFRLCSSGISQAVELDGEVQATAPYPGQGDMLGARLGLPVRGHLPVDRFLVWPCVAAVAGLPGWQILRRLRRR